MVTSAHQGQPRNVLVSDTNECMCMHAHVRARVCIHSATRQRASGKQPTHRKMGEAPARACMLLQHSCNSCGHGQGAHDTHTRDTYI